MDKEFQLYRISELMPPGFLEGVRWNFNGQWIVFDPLNDLNAAHEVEIRANMIFSSDYSLQLARIGARSRGFNPDKLEFADCLSIALHTNAEERMEAVLRTENIWEE